MTDDDLNRGEPNNSRRRPQISIITINFNNQAGLARTLSSMAEQTYADFEQIVVDGGSTDGSVDVLRHPRFKVDRWVSEPDRGIYNAMNKGIGMATGRYLLFINSGDHLLDSQSLAMAAEVLTGRDLHYFSTEIRPAKEEGEPWIKEYPDQLTFSYFCRDTLPHPSTLIRANLFERIGLYDESLRICADWKHFMLSVCRHNCTYASDPRVLGVFYLDGLSSNPEEATYLLAERQRVLSEEFPAFLDDVRQLFAGEDMAATLAALRASRAVRWARRLGLLWSF